MFISVLPVALFLLSIYYLRTWWKDRQLPPGPIGLPIVGYLPFLGSNPAIDYMRLAKKYGPVFSIRIGFNTMVILNTRDAVYEVLNKQGKLTSDRPRNPVLLELANGTNFGMLSGIQWKTGRTLAIKFLKNFNKQTLERTISEECEYLCDFIRENNEKPIEDHAIFSKAIVNVLCSFLFGDRLSYDDERLIKFVSFALQFSDETHGRVVGISLIAPFLRYFPFIKKLYQEMIIETKDTEAEIDKIIDDHRQTYDENCTRDYVDFVINEIRSSDSDSDLVKQPARYLRSAMTLMAAGTDSTSGIIRWFLLGLALYPECQTKISDEISEVVGFDGKIEMKHKDEMPYTRAFIQEILRYQTPAPLAVAHNTSSEVAIQEFKIPPNTTIIPNLWACHRNPKAFENPNTFEPERFLDSEGKFVSNDYVIPFSIGSRLCFGEQIAKMQLFLFLTNLVQKFEIRPSKNKPLPSFDEGVFAIGWSPLPFAVEFHER